MKLDLSSITLVSLIWNKSQHHMDRTVRVFNYLNSMAVFHDAILFTGCTNFFELRGRVVQVPIMDEIGWQTFQMRIIPQFIKSPFMMNVQYDGFILDASKWEREFLWYDMIGAPWPDGVVGNDGFCIQSQAFLKAKAALPFIETKQGDDYLCRDKKSTLEGQGIKFAPTDVALRFATETYLCDRPSFGFHGRTHDAAKYKQGWKQIEEWEATR